MQLVYSQPQIILWRKNSEFRPVKLCLKIDLVSYPARAEGLEKKKKEVHVV